MNERLSGSCRGCLFELETGCGYSLKLDEIRKLFAECIGIEIDSDDGMPDLICFACHKKCLDWQLFKGTCGHSDRLLRTMLRITSKPKTPETSPEHSQKVLTELKSVPLDKENEPSPSSETDPQSEEDSPVLESKREGKNTDTGTVDKDDVEEEEEDEDDNPEIEYEIQNEDCEEELEIQQPEPKKRMIDIQEPEKTFNCPICSNSFSKESAYKTHMAKHKSVTKSSDVFIRISEEMHCFLCSQSLTDFDSFRMHVFAKHTPETEDQLICCQRTFDDGKHFLDHVFSHTGMKLPCGDCGFLGSSPSEVLKHKQELHDYNRDMCRTCGKMVRNMYQHRAMHDPNRAKFRCSQCERRFYSSTDLKRHVLTHTGEKPLSCENCGKRFTTPGNLKQHMMAYQYEKGRLSKQLERNVANGPFTCGLCEDRPSFEEYEHFKDHIFSSHGPTSNGDEFQCVRCDFQFPDGRALLDHIFKEHKAGPELKCTKCDHRETLPTKMESHLVKTHKARKMCPICGIRVVDAVYHRKTHLPPSSQFVCQECGKVFYSQTNLKTHRLVHGDGNSFVCDVCGVSFRMNKSLAQHKLKAHSGMKS